MYQNDNGFNPNPVALNPYQQNLDIVKNYFKKPIVLVYAIVSAIVVIVSCVFSLNISSAANSMVEAITAMAGEPAIDGVTASTALSTMSSAFFSLAVSSLPVIAFFSLAVSSLPVIAFFFIYFKSKDSNPFSNPSGGFTIMWVLSIIGLVAIAIGVLFVFLGFALLFVISAFAGEDVPAAVAPVLIILLIVLLPVFAISLFYQISELRFFGSIRKSTKGLELKANGAAPYGVLCIISGVSSAMSIFSLVMMPAFFEGFMSGLLPADEEAQIITAVSRFMVNVGVLSVIPSILSAAQAILMGVIALGYNKYIKGLTSSYPTNNGGNGDSAQPAQVTDSAYNANPYVQPQTPNAQPPIDNQNQQF